VELGGGSVCVWVWVWVGGACITRRKNHVRVSRRAMTI
jgi:hypothetical protein